MVATEFLGLIIFLIVSLGLLGLAIPLCMGKCARIIAGYSTMTPEERAHWDGPGLAKFAGKILLIIGLATAAYGAGLFCLGLVWLTWIYLAVVLGLSIFAVIYCNTGKRFQK